MIIQLTPGSLKFQVFNASTEVAKAANYPKIRIFMAALKSSPVPVEYQKHGPLLVRVGYK